MFAKTIKYKNFNDEEVEKTFYFHFGKAELLEMAASEEVEGRLKRISATKNPLEVLREIKALVELAVGEKSEDGERFLKTPEVKAKLMQSPAWDELLMEFATQAEATLEFVKNALPTSMQADLIQKLKEQADAPDPFNEKPIWIREDREPTPSEIQSMTSEQLREVYARKLGK